MWEIGAAANGIVAVAYLAIAAAIIRPLITERQVRHNRLGTATAAIFFTCAVDHGGHTVHMLLPYLGLERGHGLAMRAAWDWHEAGWDVLTAAVGIYYWSLRRTYAPLMRGAKLFEDLRERQRQALEIHDNILQGLVVAQMALALDDPTRSRQALEATIVKARCIIGGPLGEPGTEGRLGPGDLVRSQPARVTE